MNAPRHDQMSSRDYQTAIAKYWTQRCKEILQDRHNLPREDLEYVMIQLDKLKDERLKACVAELIGWGDQERADLETFCAVALELLKSSSPSRLRDAVKLVELRYLTKEIDRE